MKNTLRLLLLGLLTWFVPFVSAFFFMDKTGQLSVDVYLFKTIMILVGGMTGAYAIILYLRKQNNNYLRHAMISGTAWFTINVVLDVLILLPMSKMAMGEYFTQIGLRYFMIPIMCFLAGYLLKQKTELSIN